MQIAHQKPEPKQAGLLLIGFGSLAEIISVPRALDIAALVPLATAVLALILPAVSRHEEPATVVSGVPSGSLAALEGDG